MKAFLTAAPKRTLSSLSVRKKSSIKVTNALNGVPRCLSSATSATAFSRTQDDVLSSNIHTCSLLFEQKRNYSAMGIQSTLNPNTAWMKSGRSSFPKHGLSSQTNITESDEKKKEGDDEMETLPPPIPGDDDIDEDFEFEDPNEAKHDPADLDGDRANFTVPVPINMPDMNDDNDTSTIEKWYKEPGDIIKRNDILCDIATPDFTFGMVTEDEFDAIMGERCVAEGESAADNAPICTIYHQAEPGAEKEKNGDEIEGEK